MGGGLTLDEVIDVVVDVEIKDNDGSTVIYGGPGGTTIADLTTTAANVPTSAGNIISGYSIEVINKNANNILISFDSGTTFELLEMRKGNFKSSNIKGNITQLKLKSTAATIDDTDYQLKIDLEAT